VFCMFLCQLCTFASHDNYNCNDDDDDDDDDKKFVQNHFIISYHIIIPSGFAMALPIRSSETPYKVKYRLNNTTNR